MKKLLIVLLFIGVGGCENTYERANPEKTREEESVSGYTGDELTMKPNLVGYLWDDVDFVHEYGKTYRPNNNTGSVNRDNIRSYRGVTTSTHSKDNIKDHLELRSHSEKFKPKKSSVQRAIAAEVAGKASFWIAKEIESQSDLRGVFETTHEYFSMFSENPYETTMDLPQDKIFYFPGERESNAVMFSSALKEAGYSEKDTIEIVNRCSKERGWGYLPTEESPLRLFTDGSERVKEEFYKKCYAHIARIVSKGKTSAILPPLVKETFAFNPYVMNRYFTPNKIKRIGKRNYPEYYDTGMIEHFRGKFGKEIKEGLHKGLKTNVYKNVMVMIPANPLEFTKASSGRKFHDDNNLKGLNFYPIHKTLFRTELGDKEWVNQTSNRLFNKRDTWKHYNNQFSRNDYRHDRMPGTLVHFVRPGLYRLGGDCKLDASEVQYAKEFTSRFVYNCRHNPYIQLQQPTSYDGLDNYVKKYNTDQIFTSRVIATSIRTGHMIKSSIPGSMSHQTMILDFRLTGQSVWDAMAHNCTEPCIKQYPLQPDSEVVTQFAMALAHDLPPWVYISWLSKGNKGYVLHKYTLYEFDLTELYNKPH